MKKMLLALSFMMLPALSYATPVRSVDWVGAYTKRLASQAYESKHTNDASNDWACKMGKVTCEICALGNTQGEAAKAMIDVITEWQKDGAGKIDSVYSIDHMKFSSVSLAGDIEGRPALYTVQACALIKAEK